MCHPHHCPTLPCCIAISHLIASPCLILLPCLIALPCLAPPCCIALPRLVACRALLPRPTLLHSLVGIVVIMLQHVVMTCHLSPISGQHGWHVNLVTEWVVGVTYHELLCVVYNTTRWRRLLSVFVTCCNATKKDVDVTSHLSCWRHVTKCHMSLTLLPSILL